MNLDFDIAQKVWWNNNSSNEYFNNDSLIENIKNNSFNIFEIFLKLDNESKREFEDYFQNYYLINSLVGEKNIACVDCKSFDFNFDNFSPHDLIKVSRFKNAIEFAFSNFDTKKFTVDFAKEINKIIIGGSNVSYRKEYSKPYGTNWLYLEPELIYEFMNKLFEYTRKQLELNNNIESLVKLAAQFCLNFLQIHPFSNGNGRVARILVSFLLLPISIIPVLLTFENSDNYLKCLQEEQFNGQLFNYKPSALSKLILEQLFKSTSYYYELILD